MAPEFGKPIHQLPLIPANVLKKHRVGVGVEVRERIEATAKIDSRTRDALERIEHEHIAAVPHRF
jgi:hypothetical protein